MTKLKVRELKWKMVKFRGLVLHFCLKITSRWERDLPYPQNNQLWEHNKAIAFCGNRQLWYLSRIRPPMLNANSEAIIVIGILIMSQAISESSESDYNLNPNIEEYPSPYECYGRTGSLPSTHLIVTYYQLNQKFDS